MNTTSSTPTCSRFYAISTFKLLVMYICTLGFYEVYWFYKQWEMIKQQEKSSVIPILRSIFGILFSYPLFRRIQLAQEANEQSVPLASMFWCVILILLNATMVLAGPLRFLTFCSILPLLVAQAAANQVNHTNFPEMPKNDKFNQIEIVIVIFGIFVWLTSFA
ncbi:hypothetical protein LIN78_00055 [Leeia sp. TBRC 13508]|uniref:DUF4234 domain-containing protein n=1 Tax=Leeia speluncae TaxID=2884804 RepID=A0ABS8D163_9NEIS|nr:hypothetical protein [Leeia speluncae]MCB6181947.1 hypothetical protein [Leeia speluncae]